MRCENNRSSGELEEGRNIDLSKATNQFWQFVEGNELQEGRECQGNTSNFQRRGTSTKSLDFVAPCCLKRILSWCGNLASLIVSSLPCSHSGFQYLMGDYWIRFFWHIFMM